MIPYSPGKQSKSWRNPGEASECVGDTAMLLCIRGIWGLSECLLLLPTRIATMRSERFLYYLICPDSLLRSAAPSYPAPHADTHTQSQQEAQDSLAYWDGLARYQPEDVMEEKELQKHSLVGSV